MNHELTAAAERVREEHTIRPSSMSVDEWDVISAYLAEHPADDATPIDADFIRAVCPVCATSQIGTRGNIGPFTLHATLGHASIECCQTVKHNATRGDVRRLCRALGIEITESS